MPFFGLDTETSARELRAGGRIIQVGAATVPDAEGDAPSTFSSLVNPGTFEWEDEAYGVHGIDQLEVKSAPLAADVDAALVAWLVEHGADPARPSSNIAIGFNVGSFDLPFVAETLPRTAALLSYRAADLNSVLFALDGAIAHDGRKLDSDGWKALSKSYAARHLAASNEVAHDAGYDAAEAVLIWRFLSAAIRREPLPLPERLVLEPSVRTHARAARAHLAVDELQAAGLAPRLVDMWARGGRSTDRQAQETLASLYEALPANVRASHPRLAL